MALACHRGKGQEQMMTFQFDKAHMLMKNENKYKLSQGSCIL